MEKITSKDIFPMEDYEKLREDLRKKVWGIKKRRRFAVGNHVSILFENRETVIHQIQEMIRTERISDPIRIQEEIDAYNPLIPGDMELSATLFIEIEEEGKIKEILDSLMGIDEAGVVYILIGDSLKILAMFEKGRSKEDKISAVHYIKFKFNEKEKKAFLDPSIHTYLTINHPNYKADVEIDYTFRKELGDEL